MADERLGVAVRRRRPNDLLPMPSWPADELAPPEGIASALAFHLWQRARDVALWTRASPAARRGLFERPPDGVPEPESPGAIRDALNVLSGVVRSPHRAVEGDVARACEAVCRWAEGEGHTGLARTWAEAWAGVDAASAQAAATAGGLCTRLAEDARAEIWLQRAVRLARAARDWEWYIRGYLRLGILKFNLGHEKQARRFYTRAYRMAVWAGFSSLAGKARHDLMTICTDMGAFDLGIEYALDVLRLYPAEDPVFPYFVHDVAFLLAQAGHYDHALPLLRAALDHVPDHRRLLATGTLARTLAALGDRAGFEALAADVAARAATSDENAAAAFVRLADAARAWGEWDRAERLAGRALEIAHRRREGQPQRLAYAVLDRVAVRDRVVAVATLRRDVRSLAPRFLARLGRHAAPAELAGAPILVP